MFQHILWKPYFKKKKMFLKFKPKTIKMEESHYSFEGKWVLDFGVKSPFL